MAETSMAFAETRCEMAWAILAAGEGIKAAAVLVAEAAFAAAVHRGRVAEVLAVKGRVAVGIRAAAVEAVTREEAAGSHMVGIASRCRESLVAST
jgi:hypothetical protein